ncbi:MAG: hypothetical protein ACKVQA_13445 [Burkholderiales bacterium]
MNKTSVISGLLFSLTCVLLNGCSEPTVGQQFRDIMVDLKAKCGKDNGNDTRCDILMIKPADPLATEEGRFAYSIKLPPPHDKPKVQYKNGMSAEAYFKKLCEKEEGDFIFRTVEGVEGIKIMRPIPKPSGLHLWDEKSGPEVGSFVSHVNGIYEYVDAVEFVNSLSGTTHLIHYVVDNNAPANTRLYAPPYGREQSLVVKSEARYGYTFRNSSLESREQGIVGQELIVLDLVKNEILALRRRFSRLKFIDRSTPQIMSSTPCRLISTENSDGRFIARVLMPILYAKGDEK